MNLQYILIILFLFLFVGTFLLWSIKTENLFPINLENIVLLDSFKMTIPNCWLQVETNQNNELSYIRGDSKNSWKAFININHEATEELLTDVIKKLLFKRNIIFDESDLINFNPYIFQDGPILKTGHFEIGRIEGPATIGKEDRGYCDVIVFRNTETGLSLYAESRGPILNGFYEARYFEDVMLRLELIK